MPKVHPRELRPYRVTMYVLYLVFTFLFIGLVIKSVWTDLYGNESAGVHMTLTACRDEIESLRNQLDARLSTPLTPRAEGNWPRYKQDWDTFARKFEDDVGRVQSQCSRIIESDPAGKAIREATERLDSLREHLARCGEEGEAEREALTGALNKLSGLSTKSPR